MRYNDFCGEKVSRLGFGMMRLPKQDGIIDLETSKKMVDEFINHGFNYYYWIIYYVKVILTTI